MTKEEAIENCYDIKCNIDELKKIFLLIEKIYSDFQDDFLLTVCGENDFNVQDD